MGQSEKALVSLKKAIELEPNFAGAYYNLGFVYKALNKEEQALRCFKKARELTP